LDAQYEAASAYIKKSGPCRLALIRSRYDDGGYSRRIARPPDLQRLLDDIRARKIDVIVVYKVDRLTRSLADFRRSLVELLDWPRASRFVSVTQQFNTRPPWAANAPMCSCPLPNSNGSHLRAHPDKIAALKAEGSLGRRSPAPWL